MHPTRLFAAAILGLLAAPPGPNLDAQSDPDRPVAGGGTLPVGWRAQTDHGRPLGVRAAELDVPGLVGYAVDHNRDAHIGALAVQRH